MAADTDLLVYSFKHYGKEFIKQCGLSPDSYIQLAMQLAYYRIHHKQPPTYETATLRRFEEGRTDTIRLPNLESAMFTYEMVDSEQEPSDTELAHMLKYAIEKHKHYTVQVDFHYFKRMAIDIFEIFSDPLNSYLCICVIICLFSQLLILVVAIRTSCSVTFSWQCSNLLRRVLQYHWK